MLDIDSAFARYFTLTGEPISAAILAIGSAMTQQPNQVPVATLTVKQAATSLGVSVDAIYDVCRAGKLRHQKIGRAIRIRPADLENFKGDTTTMPTPGLRCLRA